MRAADRFVVDHWRSLLPTAYLLTGTDAGARDLLARGLSAARKVRGVEGRDQALAGLVRAALSRWWRGADAAITDTTTAAWWASPADAEAARRLSAALDRLTPGQRVAVVLRWYEGLGAARVAELVPGVDADAAAAELAGEVPDLGELPARLEGMVAQTDLTALTDEAAVATVAGVGARRRNRAVLAVAVVGALAVGTVVAPQIGPGPVADPAPTSSATPTEAPPPSFAAGPTRGSLTDDEAFLGALRDRVDPGWRNPGADSWRVVYAGDLQGVRAALLVRFDAGPLQTTWFTGPAGAAAGELNESIDSAPLAQQAAAVTYRGDPTTRPVLLVVAAPGDEVDVSSGIDVAADGTAGREFRPVPVQDGVALQVLDRSSADAARFRVTRDGVPVEESPVSALNGFFTSIVDAGGSPQPSRSGDPTASSYAYESSLAAVTGPTGYAADELAVTVLGAGSFPAPGGDTVDAVTLAVVLPTGAVVTTTGFGSAETIGGTTSYSWGGCGSTGHPAGTDPATLTVVARCASYAGDSSTFGVTVVVAAPTGAAVTLDSAGGGAPVTPELTNGWAFVIDGADELTQYAVDGALGTASREGADLFSS